MSGLSDSQLRRARLNRALLAQDHIYADTAADNAVEKRRAKNRAAKQSRRINRGRR
ncbi:hypothetical protein [Williamsia deligens]|uniref:30S ribosomal protein S20 n=1 Tax=Williamsia deligens TaxID=321325 RepID=A0ABW3GA10_9NOCA|nr:hypothetical protein [Williamsia deligens]MCP2195680.1 hypothetical protein [Williamsia deligens]